MTRFHRGVALRSALCLVAVAAWSSPVAAQDAFTRGGTGTAVGVLTAPAHSGATTTQPQPGAQPQQPGVQPQQPAPQPQPGAQQQPDASQGAGIDWRSGWTFGLRTSVTFLDEESLDTGFGFSGFAVLPLSTDFELEGEVGYQTMGTAPPTVPEGRLSMFPLRATLRVQLWRFRGAKPYAGGGIGVYITRFSLSQSVRDDLATVGFDATADVDPGLGFHGAAGVEWERDRFHFGVDVKYVFGDAETVSTLVDQVTQQVFRETAELSFDGFWIAAGVRVSF